MSYKLKSIFSCLFVFLLISFLFSIKAQARVVTGVDVTLGETGYDITIEFLLPLRYTSYSPSGLSKELQVQLKPINFERLTAEQIDDLRDRISLSWDESTGVPLKEITFEGGDPEQPKLTFHFEKEIELFEVHSTSNLQKLTVTLKTPVIPPPDFNQIFPTINRPQFFTPEDPALVGSMQQADTLLTENNFVQAIEWYKEIYKIVQGRDRQRTEELLGYALEKNGDFVQAKAVYMHYLETYPRGMDYTRVEQRLQRIESIQRALRLRKIIYEKLNKGRTYYYGAVSNFFTRDQTTPQGSQTQVNRQDFLTNADLNGGWKNQDYEIRSQIDVSYRNRLLAGEKDDDLLNILSLEALSLKNGLSGKIGRQIVTAEGVFDLFDGLHAGYKMAPKLTLNTVHGFPVTDTSVKEVNDNKEFHGVSLDLGTFKDYWNFTTYFMNQENQGLTDRRALGGEMNYYGDTKSLYSTVDYDVFFEKLNIFLVNGWWTIFANTTLGLVLDYRNTPSLTTNNALEGQAVTELQEFFSFFSKEEIYQFAQDRTAISKTLSVSVTQNLKKDVQLTGDVTVFEWEGTTTSGGVEGFAGEGKDYFYSLQLITSNTFIKGDVITTNLNIANKIEDYTYGFIFTPKFPIKKKLQLTPEMWIEYLAEKNSPNSRFSIRPSLRADYRVQKWLRFETKAGTEWANRKTTTASSFSSNLFLVAGFTISF